MFRTGRHIPTHEYYEYPPPPPRIVVLMGKVEENLEILQSKFTNNITNKLKTEVWAKITTAVSATGLEVRTPVEVRENWKICIRLRRNGSVDIRRKLGQLVVDRLLPRPPTKLLTCSVMLRPSLTSMDLSQVNFKK